ncbi:PREDICTED: tropomyosin-2-like [Nicotiana attenuata]|uniref:tropomyosin-2-like n=1 Tax=Nicotiana attenuata TaxID=49451 RepID=UPI000905A36C|nr:PREDICTED: tropomyosin-2-like [Nicotiana attenuata]
MEAIHRNSVLEEQLRAKDEELELGKGVAAECEHLQEKLRSMQSEMDQNLIRVEAMSAEWMGKLTELERKVACLENIERAWSSALARAAPLENTIRVLQSEQESERATTTLREARLEEHIGEIDRNASTLADRVAALEAEKEQLLVQVESSSAAAPPHLHELWVHAESQRDIYKSLWEAGKVTEAAYVGVREKAREARVNCGYDFATPEANEGAGDEGGSPGMKKPPVRVTDLETELAQLQDELKKVKDQLTSSESLKRRAQIEAEEAKNQLAAMSEKLEESEKQLVELSDSEDARILQLRKISQDRDRAWKSELEAIQKQHEYELQTQQRK